MKKSVANQVNNDVNNGVILDVYMDEFIDEYFKDNANNAPFNYNTFRELIHTVYAQSIEVMRVTDGFTDYNSCSNYHFTDDFFEEYGILRYAYELHVMFAVMETQVGDGYWNYKLLVRSNKTDINITFCTDTRIMAFIQHENEMLAEAYETAEQLEHLNDKTVLCLESEPALFKRATAEIAEAIQYEYYDNIEDFEYPNFGEVIDDWMKYRCRGSHKLVDEIIGGGTQLVIMAVERAFNWYADGINAGLIHDNIKK